MAEERLQKILARAGVASRRKAEDVITAGRVRVDGVIVKELGAKADPKRARIELDGRRLEPEPLCYGVLHKPRGMLTTLSDPEGRPTAREILREVGVRVVPVGRLDFNTSGVLLFTNDGDFAQALTHAKNNVPKVYAATVAQSVDEATLEKWGQSIEIEGKTTRPASVRVLRRDGKKSWMEVTLKEGKNRQVRRLGEHAGTPVSRLSRLSHAEITCEGLRPGQWRLLTVDELKALKKSYGVPEKLRGILEEAPGRKRGGPVGAKASKPSRSKKGGGAKSWSTKNELSKKTTRQAPRRGEATGGEGSARSTTTKASGPGASSARGPKSAARGARPSARGVSTRGPRPESGSSRRPRKR